MENPDNLPPKIASSAATGQNRTPFWQWVFLLFLGLFALAVLQSFLGQKKHAEVREENPFNFVRLDQLPGIKPEVIQANGILLKIEEPIPVHRLTGTCFFSVRILDHHFRQRKYRFEGDAENLRNLVNEILFVRNRGDEVGVEEGLKGARDAVNSMVSGVKDIVSHPIQSAAEIINGIDGAWDYIKKAATAEVNVTQDAEDFAQAYYQNIAAKISRENGFSLVEAQTPEARNLVYWFTNRRCAGEGATHVLSLFLPTATLKVVKAAKFAGLANFAMKLERGGEIGKGFSNLVRRGAAVFDEAPHITQSLARIEKLRTLRETLGGDALIPLFNSAVTNPIGVPGAKSHFRKMLYYMHQEASKGADLSRVIDRAMRHAGADRRIAEHAWDPHLVKRQLLESHEHAKSLGIFDSSENLERLRRGNAPRIMRGPFQGNIAEIDRIVPEAVAEELKTCYANYRLMPDELNRIKSATIDKDVIWKIKEFEKAGLISKSRADAIRKLAQN